MADLPVVPNPVVEAKAFLDALADSDLLPDDTTYDVDFPTSLTALYIQYAWDGSPDQADNRESCALRFTVWAPRGRATDAQDLAGALLVWIFDPAAGWTSPNLWRVNRGTGRLVGTDPSSKLEFCTVTVYPQLHAAAS